MSNCNVCGLQHDSHVDVTDTIVDMKTRSNDPFVSLHVHTEHSFLDGIPTVTQLVDRIVELDQEAVAITDHGECSGHIRLQKAADKAGIKPLFGIEGYFTDDRRARLGKKGEFSEHQILIAQNQKGLENLWALSSLAFLEGMYYDPRTDWELLEKYSDGLISTTGCLGGQVTKFFVETNKAFNPDKGYDRLSRMMSVFKDRFYVELHTFRDPVQEKTNKLLVELANEFSLPMIVVSDSHYLRPDEWKEHELLTAIQMGLHHDSPERYQYGPDQLRLFSSNEILDRLDYLPRNIVEEAIKNTSEIAKSCDARIEEVRNMPVFFESVDLDERELRKYAQEGFDRKIHRSKPDWIPLEDYEERLQYELKLITSKKYCGYFLFVRDMIVWAKDQGQLVGPARGSAGGSLLSYVLDITDVDPLRAGLIFERFLDPGRDTLPDIDIDFPRIERYQVRQFLEDKYGQYSIATIGTLNRLAPRMLLRDLCRGLRINAWDTEQMSKIIEQVRDIDTANIEIGWDEILAEKRGDLQVWAQKYPYLFELMGKFHGHIRHAGAHAAGTVISKDSLIGKLPLRLKKGDVRTQMDMGDVEYLGFVKVDMLGLRTLSTLMRTWELVNKRHGEGSLEWFANWQYDWAKFYEDRSVYESLWNGKNIGVFQLETSGLRSLTKRYKPETLEDIADLISVFRPGITRTVDTVTGLNMLEYYMRKREGKMPVIFQHPLLEEVVGKTYGNFVYQEQIMRCCNVLAGYSLSETDRVRKILGKMLYDKMKSERETFIRGCNETNAIPEEIANAIFDDFEKAGVYVYNKSHGYAYGMIAYWCAYVKHYWPREFMTALFQTNPQASVVYTRECRRMGIPIAGPDVNESNASFTLTNANVIRYGLSTVKFLAGGSKAVQELRPFSGIQDMVNRIPKRTLNKRAMLSLIRVGALNEIVDKSTYVDHWSIEKNVLYQYWKARGDWPKMDDQLHVNGVLTTLFENYADEVKIDNKILAEEELLGTLVTVDPLGPYATLIAAEETFPGEHQMLTGEVCRLGGVITKVTQLITKKGKNPGAEMAQVWIEIPSTEISIEEGDDDEEEITKRDESIQVVIFPSTYEKIRSKLDRGAPVLMDVEKLQNGGLSVRRMFRLDEMK